MCKYLLLSPSPVGGFHGLQRSKAFRNRFSSEMAGTAPGDLRTVEQERSPHSAHPLTHASGSSDSPASTTPQRNDSDSTSTAADRSNHLQLPNSATGARTHSRERSRSEEDADAEWLRTEQRLRWDDSAVSKAQRTEEEDRDERHVRARPAISFGSGQKYAMLQQPEMSSSATDDRHEGTQIHQGRCAGVEWTRQRSRF